MNTSSRFVVGVHILTAMAGRQLMCTHVGIDPKTRSEQLAESVNTNPVVIRRILGDLQQAGLIASKQGRGGGSYLVKPPEAITLQEVYDAIEGGGLFHFHYSTPNPVCPVGENIQDALVSVFDRAEAAMKAELATVTIAKLVQDVMARSGIQARLEAGATFEALYQEMIEAEASSVFA